MQEELSLLSELTASCTKVLFKDRENNILTHEQKEYVDEIIQHIMVQNTDVSYIAPTSYGKSSLITQIIKTKNVNKIGIIVPTKSLLQQTYKMIKKANLGYKLLLHDEMFDDEQRFIAIFTQERALRFFDKYEKYFDLLFIDEAHNLLENDQRSILLSRVIKLNKLHNNLSPNIYLTPLLQDSRSISHVDIIEKKIQYSMKEPEYLEYMKNNHVRKYNRFFNIFYPLLDEYNNFFDYIIKNSMPKSFIFLASPKKIEYFSRDFIQQLPDVDDDKISDIITTLKEYVSPNFPMIDLIKKGCIYLHGKIPDELKDYLEYKFQTISSLKYIVANSVVLEGINMPVDTLFIMNRYKQTQKSIVNLIGRVNRLNNIFDSRLSTQQSIQKLVPQIHFINSDEYDQKDGKMSSMIEKLRSSTFKDKKENPMLKTREELTEDELKIVEAEAIVTDITDTSLKSRLIHHNIHSFYINFNSHVQFIELNINRLRSRINNREDINPIDMIADLFIHNMPDGVENEKNDFEFFRLENEKARNYYKNYFLNSRHFPFSQRVQSQVAYFNEQVKNGNKEFYIGKSFGEIPKSSPNYPENLKVYVNLRNKSNPYLTNISVIKLKIEQDFISYKLSRCFSFMYEFELLREDQYYELMYGTTNIQHIRYIKAGLSLSMISKLGNQLDNLRFDNYNNLYKTDDLDNYLNELSDFDRFQIERILCI
ncbi:MAG: DEAD/DEAH box helicase [Brevinema sp.]